MTTLTPTAGITAAFVPSPFPVKPSCCGRITKIPILGHIIQAIMWLVQKIFSCCFKPSLVQQMGEAISEFQQNKGYKVTPNCQHVQIGDVHFYGIHKDQQIEKIEISSIVQSVQTYQKIKEFVLEKMKLAPGTPVVQVVGDSDFFSLEGTEKAKQFLQSKISLNSVVLYGYTGHANTDGRRCVNAAVSDIMKNNLNRVIGNLVGFHTPVALTNWGCSGADLKHYFVVYGNDESRRETGTVFGDDIITSDFFAERLLVVDGGPQSLTQVFNTLLIDQPVDVVFGLRPPERLKSPSTNISFFNAGKFLHDMTQFVKGKTLTEKELNDWYKDYFGEKGKEKCYIGNPAKQDYDTKQKLFDAAWKLFIEYRLDKKLERLVKFHN